MKGLSSKCLIILKTTNLYLCFFTLGMSMAVPGPCLLDLKNIVNTDTQRIAFIYTARFIGYLAGSVLGGILLDFIKSKQVVMTVFNFVMSLSMLIMPWSRNLGTLIGLMAVNGFSIGALDTGGNVLCLTLWESESGPFFQALHFNFGVGSLVAPLIAAPFLGSYNDDFHFSARDNTTFSNNSALMNYNENSYSSTTENTFLGFSLNNTNYTSEYLSFNSSNFENSSSNIVYPFSIIGGFGILVAVMFLGTTFASPLEKKTSQRRNSDDAKITMKFLLTVGILNVLLLFFEAGTEIGYPQMLTTYVVKGKLQLSSSTGSYMTSAFWAAFTVSRLISIFLAIKISSFAFILTDLTLMSFGSLLLLFLSSYEWAIWITSILLGAGVAAFFPAAIGWLNCYITVTNKIASIFIIGASLGGMTIPLTISYFIETFPDVLIYVVPLTVLFCSLVTLILYLILKKKEKKRIKKEPESIAFITSKITS